MTAVAAPPSDSITAPLSDDDRELARTYLGDFEDTITRQYVPADKVTKAFAQRCKETNAALAGAKTNNQAFGLVADAFCSLDPRIRFYPPARSINVDYGWRWQIYGDKAYVVQVDQVGDARKQGLKLGDRIVSIEGLPLTRATAQQAYYAFETLAPSPTLTVEVQAPGGESRRLALAATLREPPKLRSNDFNGVEYLEFVRTKRQWSLANDLGDARKQVRLIGRVALWTPDALHARISDVTAGLKAVRDADALILDLRGHYVLRHETAGALLDGLFAESFDLGYIQVVGTRDRLRVSGGGDSFHGTVLVLIDAETAMYGEVIARTIQWKRRGVLIGDRTMGRVFKEAVYGHARGTHFNFTNAFVSMPAGEIVLAEGPALDGSGVAPDLLLLPKPADLAGQRDVVLAKALAMLKQTVPPEEAWTYSHKPEQDEDR